MEGEDIHLLPALLRDEGLAGRGEPGFVGVAGRERERASGGLRGWAGGAGAHVVVREDDGRARGVEEQGVAVGAGVDAETRVAAQCVFNKRRIDACPRREDGGEPDPLAAAGEAEGGGGRGAERGERSGRRLRRRSCPR